MESKEVMNLLDSVSEKLEKAEPSLRNAVKNYQALNYSQRKECAPSWKRLGNAVAALVKASGAGWWHKWGKYIGWVLGIFFGGCFVLGLLKVLFEH